MATLGSDIYKIQEFNEELIKSNINEDSSTLAIGIFGYLEDAFSHIMQNNIIVSSEYINEMFPTRVKYEKSIMDYAMLYNVDEINATPSTMSVVLCLMESEVEKVLRTRTDETFIIDKDYAFYFGEFEFHLEYDIELKRSRLQDKTIMYTATYNNSIKNPISKITTPYLTTPYRQTINGTRYIFINCILRQVTYSETYKKIINSNPITNKSLEFEFGDQLSSFSVKIKQGNTEFNVVPLLDGSSNVGVEDKYCYYRFINSSNIRLLFDSDSYIPKLNDEITISIQSTKGIEGNFEYKEDITTNMSSEKYGYDNVPVLIKPVTNAEYGEDKITIDELKKIIPREAVARGSITNTTDLYNYFNTISTDSNKLTFVKKSDNQFERLYYSYLLVKNEYGEIIPTNTINIDLLYFDSQDPNNVDFDSSISNRYILKPGNHFKYSKNSRNVWTGQRVLREDLDYFENYLDESKENDFIYSNPFLIVINTKPLLYISYYLNILNKKYELLTDTDNINKDSELQFIALSCDWKRGYKEDTYKLSFQCTQNINEDKGMILKDENNEPIIDDNGNYITKVRSILAIGDYSAESSNTSNNCFVEGTLTKYSDTGGLFTYQFDFKIPTDDKINENNTLEIYDIYKSGSNPVDSIYVSDVKVRNKILDADGEYNLISETSTSQYAEWKRIVDNETYIISHTDSDTESNITDWGWSGKIHSSFVGEDIISIKSPGRPISDNLERIIVENINVKSSIGLDKAIGEYLLSESSGNIITWKRNIIDEFTETGDSKEYEFIVSYNTDSMEWTFEIETDLDLSSALFSDFKVDNNKYSDILIVKDVYSSELVDTIDGEFMFYADTEFSTVWKRQISSKVEYNLTHEKKKDEWILSKPDEIELYIAEEDIKMEPSISVYNTFNSLNIHTPEAEGVYYQSNVTPEYIEWRKGGDRVYIVRYRKNEEKNPWILIGPGSPSGEIFSYFDAEINSTDSVNILKVIDVETGEIVKTAIGTYELYEDSIEERKWRLDIYNKSYYLTRNREGIYSMLSVTRYDNPKMDQTATVNIKSVENMKIYILYEDENVVEDNKLTSDLKTKIVPSSYPISLNNYVVSNVYNVNGDKGGEFFFNYTDIISSKATVTQETNSEDGGFRQYLHLDSVPMVRSAYMDEESFNSEELIDIIETKRGYIENALSILEDQFGIDFKFYNTYGPSRTFFIDGDELDRVDIKLKFEISLKAGADKANINLIKDDIKKYVENLNNTEYNLHMSNIITEITNKYSMDTLNYIEFNDINGNATYKQFLSRIPTNELSVNTPPEFINIHNIYEMDYTNEKMVSNGIGITMDIVV